MSTKPKERSLKVKGDWISLKLENTGLTLNNYQMTAGVIILAVC